MDEPCSALDPIATARIEELIDELRQNFTIVIVTHSMQQAARVSQKTAFFHLGDLVESGATPKQIFTNPGGRSGLRTTSQVASVRICADAPIGNVEAHLIQYRPYRQIIRRRAQPA